MLLLSLIRSSAVVTAIGIALAACSPQTSGQKNADNTASNTAATANHQKPSKTIAISAIVVHPSLDAIRQGIIDELASEGYVKGQNLTVNFQSAQGNTATAGQISKQFVADKPDVIVAISTPTAQSLAAATKNIPIVYTAVSDPVAAKLINQQNVPIQPNITGLSSQLPLAPQLDFIQKMMPSAKAIGYVFSAGEINSVALRDRLNVELPKRAMSLVDIPANRPTDIAMATNGLSGKAQMIYTSMDNNVASAFESMVQSANALKLPIIASDEFSVRRGATAALGVNDYDFGRTTGKMVGKILDGTPVNQVKPAVMNQLTLYVSPKHAQAQGLTLSPDLLKSAVNVDTTPARKIND